MTQKTAKLPKKPAEKAKKSPKKPVSASEEPAKPLEETSLEASAAPAKTKPDMQLLKQAMRNYFVSLKYFFTPLGTMFLGMMIGFSILIPGIVGATSALANGVGELAANVNLDVNVFFGSVWESVRALDWGAPFAALRTLLSADWLNTNVVRALEAILGTDFEAFQTQLSALAGDFAGAVGHNVAVFLACWAVGFFAGFFLVKFQIRRNIARRTLWKLILTSLLNSIFTTAFIIAASVLLMMWGWSLIISAILLLLLINLIALLEAYLVHGRGKIPAKAVVNTKNVWMYAISGVLIYAVTILITLAACLFNKLMGIFVGLSLLGIAETVIHLNAESYVLSVASPTPAPSPETEESPQ